MTITDPVPVSTGHDDIDAMIAGLTDLAIWRTDHPEIDGDLSGTVFITADWRNPDLDPAGIVRIIAQGAPLGSITKRAGVSNPEIMFIERRFGGQVKLQYQAAREQVCTRRVIGTELVEVPDPDAPLVKVEQEIVEWDCQLILAGVA